MVSSRSITIGVVEDSAEDFQTFSRVFADGEQLIRWADGESCLAHLRDHRDLSTFNVLVIDLDLPGISGTEVIRAIRGLPSGQHAAIFVLTGSADPAALEAASAAGADEFFTKPNTVAGMRGIAAQIADLCS